MTTLTHHERIPRAYPKDWETLDEQFTRCHETLHFIASRILADSELAACAVENCRGKASRNLPSFDSEGAFGSWVLRLLISEALAILHQDHAAAF